MNKEIPVEESKAIQLAILKNFRDFCKKNGFRYCLAYGTLLGAIRHNGFIPWDDDIDVWMPREDYERFFAAYNDEHYIAVNCNSNSDYYLPFGKVYDSQTVLKEAIDTKLEIGVYIDIFPLDYTASEGVNKKVSKTMKRLTSLKNRRLILIKNHKGFIKRFCLWIIKLSAIWVNPNRVAITMNNIASMCGNDTSKVCDFVREPEKLYPMIDFFPTAMSKFEDDEFAIPNNSDAVLRAEYGEYMVLPPEDKRVTHHAYKQYYREYSGVN